MIQCMKEGASTPAYITGENAMAKGMHQQKNTKKKAAKTLMEKRAAKAAKRGR
jgi:hypothetical protein